MTHTTQSNNAPKAFTLDDLQKAADLIKSIPLHTDWVLAAPDGRVWKGHPADLLNILLPHHPLMKPMSLGEIFK